MDFLDSMNKLSECAERKEHESTGISKETNDKFDKLMGDDTIGKLPDPDIEGTGESKLEPAEIDRKFHALFDLGNSIWENRMEDADEPMLEGEAKAPKDMGVVYLAESADTADSSDTSEQEPDYSEKREANSKYEWNGNTYETDDNGQTYKKNGETLPNIEYTVNGSRYKTDEHGRTVSCDAKLKYTEEGTRNTKEQKESGGEEKKEDDDGGHIIARILGGAEGVENLIPMRRTLNRGDYKRMENEIAKALQEGKKVTLHIDIAYEKDSGRPSKIRAEYTIDGKKTVCEFDNVEASTDLLDSVKNKISDEDYDRLKQELAEMKEDGEEATITSVKVKYDENGNPMKVTVGVLDESTGTKSYKEYDPR